MSKRRQQRFTKRLETVLSPGTISYRETSARNAVPEEIVSHRHGCMKCGVPIYQGDIA